MFRTDVYMAYLNEDIVKYRQAQDDLGRPYISRGRGHQERLSLLVRTRAPLSDKWTCAAYYSNNTQDCDVRRVLKVALATWAARAGGRALAPLLETAVDRAYFSPWDLG